MDDDPEYIEAMAQLDAFERALIAAYNAGNEVTFAIGQMDVTLNADVMQYITESIALRQERDAS